MHISRGFQDYIVDGWYTVWKFQDFPVTRILREINFGEFRGIKIADFCHFRDSEVCEFGRFQPLKSAKIHKNQNSQPPKVLN